MSISTQHPLVSDIARVFDVSPEFIQEYMGRQSFPDLARHTDWEGFSASLNTLQRMYVEFAMTCVLRARSVVDLIGSRIGDDRPGRRYLDVGCGYGGFVREFARRGYEAVGIELQPHLASFSAANCTGLSNTKIINSDFLAVSSDSLGCFDAITCNDVIEHVQDPVEVMHKMTAMLRPGGILFMEIPNRDCIESVRKDGHFQLFGVTQLERNAASAYLAAMSGRTDYLQEMGELYELDFYRSILSSAGNSVETVQKHVIGQVNDVPRLGAELAAELASWFAQAVTKLGPHLSMHVLYKMAEYQSRLWSDFGALQRGVDREMFELKYLNSFWSLLVTRRK